MSSSRRSLRRVFVICAVTALTSVALAFIVSHLGPPDKDSLDFEFRKQLIQFLVIISLGAIVAFLVESIRIQAEQRARDRRDEAERLERKRQYEIDVVSSFLERLDSIYRRVKNSRQRLGFLGPHAEIRKVRKEMWRMRAEMEDLEQLDKDIEVQAEAIRDLVVVRNEVKIMDRYVGERWKEYRRIHDATGEEPPSFGAKLSSFVADSAQGDFPKFASSYHKARRVLVEMLITVSSAQPRA
jgi:hypothetical protein